MGQSVDAGRGCGHNRAIGCSRRFFHPSLFLGGSGRLSLAPAKEVFLSEAKPQVILLPEVSRAVNEARLLRHFVTARIRRCAEWLISFFS